MKYVGSILDSMYTELERVSPLYKPSSFWRVLSKTHKEQLRTAGLDNFKRSVNTRYFDWGILGILCHQWLPIANAVKKRNFSPFTSSEFPHYTLNTIKNVRNFNPLASYIYKVYVSALYKLVREKDTLHLFDKITEPALGNPYTIEYKGKKITQDICNSILELYSILETLRTKKRLRVLELGAGYGRFAYVFKKTFPDSVYTIVDIPPALFISQTYLSQLFSKEKQFHFRSFTDFKKIKYEFNKSNLHFLMSNQMELIPSKSYDLVVTTSSLHEMSRPQITHYLRLINRLCKGYIYIKQWKKSVVKDNQNIREDEYPIPRSWKVIYQRQHCVQSLFFEALYAVS